MRMLSMVQVLNRAFMRPHPFLLPATLPNMVGYVAVKRIWQAAYSFNISQTDITESMTSILTCLPDSVRVES